jgi:hypothetical protein
MVGIGATAIAATGTTVKAGGWESLSLLLTVAYQLGGIILFGHHLLHIYEGYLSVGLARPTWYEFGLVATWVAIAVILALVHDPKLAILAGCWLLSAMMLFFSATSMERARKRLKRKHGYRARRATDVIRESGVWARLCSRFAQVEDAKVYELRKKLSQPDTEDGNLSRTSWAAFCASIAIGLVAAASAVGSTVLPGEQDVPGLNSHPKEASKPRRVAGGVPKPPKEGVDVPTSQREDCGERFEPINVPEPARKALVLAWRDVGGLDPERMEALGSDIAGCPGPAQPIPGLPGSWYAPGYCEGTLRGIAIALSGDLRPVFLLEQTAEFALPLIHDGRFVSAVDRFDVGGGDAYVIDSRDGSFVPIRDAVTAGPVDEGSQDREGGCGSYADRDVAYGIAGPGVIEAWRTVAAGTGGGVYPIAWGAGVDDKVRVALRERGAGIVTVANCTPSLLACEAKIDGQLHQWSGDAPISQAEVEALVEP